MRTTDDIDQIISATFFLMTRYSLNPEIALAEMINQQLSLLASHPDNQSKTIQKVCAMLSCKWQSICDYKQYNNPLIN